MQQRRDWLVIAAAIVGGVGLGQSEGACPTGAGVFRGWDAAAAAALLATGETLRFAVTPDADGTPAPVAVFATAGFEEALAWLGCGTADACPSRSCDR